MTVQEVTTLCKEGLTGETQADLAFLEKQMRRFSKAENAEELLAAINEIAFGLLPKEKQELFLETTCVNGKRFDLIFRDALEQIKEKKFDEAAVALRAIAQKVKQHFGEGAEKEYFSFRNPFEYHMFLQLNGADRKVERAPFDFAHYLMNYGFVLIELHRLDEALEALEAAVRFNPVNCDVRFELAELFKLTQQPTKLLAVTRETLQFAPSTYALARAYANIGYACVELRDLDAAACFFYESLVYNNHPGVQAELTHLSTLTNKKQEPPTRKQVLDAFEKYGMLNGPSPTLVSLSVTLAGRAIETGKLRLGYYFYTIALDLTRDPDIRKRLESLKQEIDAGGEPNEI